MNRQGAAGQAGARGPWRDPTAELGLLEDLGSQAMHLVLLAAFAAFIAALALLAFWLDRVEVVPFWLTMLLGASVAASHVALRRGRTLAACLLFLGVGAAITIALGAFPGAQFGSLYVLVVVAVGAVLGWRWAAAAAVLATAGLVAGHGAGSLDDEAMPVSLLLPWAGVGLGWLLTRPASTAFVWAWHSYNQAQAAIAELRERQGELGRLSKSLAETCARLEEANLELERARAAAEHARQLKAEFAAAISHELRTPLNLIIGFSEMMTLAPRAYRGESLPPAYQSDLAAIYRNACHLSELIDDVLDLSQVDAHRMALQRETVPLAEVVAEAVATIRGTFEEAGLAIAVDLPPDLPPLEVDRTRLRQVLINLLANAARFTVRGGATISARLADDGREVAVAVADTGIGIAAADLPFVFQEFRQLGSGQWRRHSGLGLAVCRRFVELHGGGIWVESRQGEGATFRFSLPLGDNVVASAREEWQSWARPVAGRRGEPLVLVLESDPARAKVVQRYLDGCRVVVVAGPADARALRLDAPPGALVLLADAARGNLRWLAEVPGGEGERLARAPVVVCDLHGNLDARDRLAVHAYLAKPVTRTALRAAIQGLAAPPRRVLVAEDDPEMARLLGQMLELIAPGCRVATVGCGDAALSALRAAVPDVLLLDLLMPGTDGYGVIEAMRADARLRAVPVIVVTARSHEELPLVARTVTIGRPEGLSVGEAMACLREGVGILGGSAG